jgi:divalent metal cation (Fe/Co/Zn/Cd) transporter
MAGVAGTARVLLGSIRLVNGTAALLAPAAVGRRIGVDPEENPAAIYVMRLFGVRTILLGTALLRRDQDVRDEAVRIAHVVHVSDTLAAIAAGVTGQLPRKAARTAAIISGANVLLALLARRGR